MKRLHFDYRMQLIYTEKASESHYTLKCIPITTDRQSILRLSVSVLPENSFCEGVDSFGNRMIYGSIYGEQEQFSFRVEGEAVTGTSAWECSDIEASCGRYRHPYGLTTPGEKLLFYHGDISLPHSSAYEQAVFLMHRLHQDFIYEKAVTDTHTTAEEAWCLGRGVCQDYAHILITLCRLSQIPARYVSGMLIGEGYSHAWVEVFSNGKWYPLDPTNDTLVTDSHIKIGTGRDAGDCMINRGILRGGGMQTQKISVRVTEINIE